MEQQPTQAPSAAAGFCHVLVLYTGGTIGMVPNEQNALAPAANRLLAYARQHLALHDEDLARQAFGKRAEDAQPLLLPSSPGTQPVLYSLCEYEPLLDSSNMSVRDWLRIAQDIQAHYDQYDGFVVLHGTDTLAYTASALSFLLENLDKPVVVTGAQIPIFEGRSDGRENMLLSILVAGNYRIPEVIVAFGCKILRGNRCTEVSIQNLDSFDSPNYPPLGKARVDLTLSRENIRRRPTGKTFRTHDKCSENVALVRLTPCISAEMVRSALAPPTEGAVLHTYGAGNVPSNRPDLLDAIREATQRGVIVVNVTQVANGSVSDKYETGQVLRALGVTPGLDMTAEAAVTKLGYVLSKADWGLHTKRQMMCTDLRGELTPSRSSDRKAQACCCGARPAA